MTTPRKYSIDLAAGTSSAGRASNEDCFLACGLVAVGPQARFHERRSLSHPLIVAVLDGLGGHPCGEVASRAAGNHLGSRPTPRDPAAVAAVLRSANAELYDDALIRPERRGMGTTVAGLVVSPDDALVFNVGDSRAYQVTGGYLLLRSVDDTSGRAAAEGWLTQSLGGGPRFTEIEPHVLAVPAEPCRWMLCTDGVWAYVPFDVIEEALRAPDVVACRDQLFRAAEAAKTPDNVTVLVIDVAHGVPRS